MPRASCLLFDSLLQVRSNKSVQCSWDRKQSACNSPAWMVALVPVTLPESQHQLWVPVFQQGNQFSRLPFFLPDESSVRGSWRHRRSFSPLPLVILPTVHSGLGEISSLLLTAPNSTFTRLSESPTLTGGNHLELWDPAVSESAPRQYQAQPKTQDMRYLGRFWHPGKGHQPPRRKGGWDRSSPLSIVSGTWSPRHGSPPHAEVSGFSETPRGLLHSS